MKLNEETDIKSTLDRNQEEKTARKTLLKGMGMMGACCLLPLIITALLPLLSSLFGINGARIASLISSLICPIMMIGMVFMMGKSGGCCSKNKKDDSI